MFNGSRYRVSVWAKLAPGSGARRSSASACSATRAAITTFHTVIGNTNVTADAWVRLVATYDVALANSSLFLYVESASSLASFYIDDVQVTYIPPPTIEQDMPSLHEEPGRLLPDRRRPSAAREVAGVHGDLLKKHFNSLTSENDMKWDATEPTEGNFTFTNADQQVAFAEAERHAGARPHAAVAPAGRRPGSSRIRRPGQPMQPTPANHDLLLQRLDNHVRGVVHALRRQGLRLGRGQRGDRREPGRLHAPQPLVQHHGHGLHRHRVPRGARGGRPGALLFINDFNTTIPTKRQCLFNVVAALQARGVPVDGVGHQMHDNLEFPSAQSMADTLDLFAGLGLTQHVTEMDVSIYTGSNNTPIANYDEIPAERFLRAGAPLPRLLPRLPRARDQLTSVTFWGLADDVTWLTSSGRVNAPAALRRPAPAQARLHRRSSTRRTCRETPATVTLSEPRPRSTTAAARRLRRPPIPPASPSP